MSEDRIGRPKACPKSVRVYPRLSGAATNGEGPFSAPKREPFDRIGSTDCLFPARAYLWAMTVHFPFQNTYAALPANFFARVAPTPVASPRLIKLNRPLAVHLGLDPDGWRARKGAEILAGKRLPDGADPIAMAYAGHQFGHFVPAARRRPRHPARRGDRRRRRPPRHPAQGLRPDAILAPRRWPRRARSGAARIHRQRGDGGAGHPDHALARRCHDRRERDARDRAARRGPDPRRRPAISASARSSFSRRAATPRACGGSPTTSSPGTIRTAANAERPYHALLEGVVARQAELVARWLLVGFIHGVMNTDNTSISGETIDYGPCAFMDEYDPAHGVLLDRRARPLRLRQPAADRALESDAARRMPAAAVLRRAGKGDRGGASRRSANSRRNSMRPIRPACAASSACSRRATATRRWRRTCWTRWPRTRPTSP